MFIQKRSNERTYKCPYGRPPARLPALMIACFAHFAFWSPFFMIWFVPRTTNCRLSSLLLALPLLIDHMNKIYVYISIYANFTINMYVRVWYIHLIAWESGLLSGRNGCTNRWRQSYSRWSLQGKYSFGFFSFLYFMFCFFMSFVVFLLLFFH